MLAHPIFRQEILLILQRFADGGAPSGSKVKK
jgi:hypothetical protein